MINRAILLFLIGILVYSCQLPPGSSPNRDPKFSFDFEGHERTFFVHAPASQGVQSNRPLVFVLHGGGGTAERMSRFINGEFNRLADENEFIVVYPQGLEKSWNDGRNSARIFAQSENINDVGFFNALIDTLSSRYPIDQTRIFCTGISNGGFMSVRLACELSDRIRAAAPITAQLSEELKPKCLDSELASILIINGTADPLVPYEGGTVTVLGTRRGTILSTEETIKFWRESLNCSASPSISNFPDVDTTDGASARQFTYTDCNQEKIVSLIRVEGGGHTWPGGKQYLGEGLVGNVCNDFEASEIIWKFFSSF